MSKKSKPLRAPKKSRRKFTDEMIATFRTMWGENWSQKDIAAFLSQKYHQTISTSSLSSARARYQLKPRERGESVERKAEKLLRIGRGIARKGSTLETMGVTPKAVAAPTSPGNRFICNTFPPGKECQWIDGHPRLRTAKFCGAQVTTPGPYCDAHRSLAYMSREEFDTAWRSTIGKNPRNM